MRHAARSDANQAEIVEALRAHGALVYVIKEPVDLLVGYRGAWYPIEVKDPGKRGRASAIQPSQRDFLNAIGAKHLPGGIVHSIEEALTLIRENHETTQR